MKDDKKHLDIDLDFLDKKDAPKTKSPKDGDSKSDSSSTYNWKNILIIGGIVLFFGWVIYSGSTSDTTSSYTNTPVTHTGNTLPPPAVDTSAFKADTPTAPVPQVKTASQICKADYGSRSYSTGNKTASGGPECDCQTGYVWNDGKTACVVAPPAPKTGYEICQDRNGPNATYDSASNSCGCASGYSLGATSQQCVSLTVARNQSCAAQFPGTSWLKNDPTDGHPICDCVAGSYFNNERTACYTLSSFTQSCVNSYGTGAMSTTENGKRVCDCGYGYDWNIQRNACVTTASINALCERDVGRNSRYSGTVADGKYQCTEPY